MTVNRDSGNMFYVMCIDRKDAGKMPRYSLKTENHATAIYEANDKWASGLYSSVWINEELFGMTTWKDGKPLDEYGDPIIEDDVFTGDPSVGVCVHCKREGIDLQWLTTKAESLDWVETNHGAVCDECIELHDADEEDDDPRCVCGVYRSEHALLGCPEGFQTSESWTAEREQIREEVMRDDDDYDPRDDTECTCQYVTYREYYGAERYGERIPNPECPYHGEEDSQESGYTVNMIPGDVAARDSF